MNLSQMSFDNGILHLANWVGNVIMPTIAAVFIIVAIIQFSKGQEFSHSMYGALACLLVSGLTRAFETFASQRAWNNPDVYWIALVTLVNWVANVILPVYAAVQVAVGALRMGMFSPIHPTSGWMRHFLAAGLCLMVSGLLRLAEFFVDTGYWRRDLKEGKPMALDVTPVYRNLRTRVTFVGLEAEDLFAILAVAVVMNIFGRFLNREMFGMPMNMVLQYVVPILSVPALMLFKYGKQRGYLLDWVMFHTKPHVFSGA